MTNVSLPRNPIIFPVNHNTKNDYTSNSLNYIFNSINDSRVMVDLSYIDTTYGINLLQTIFIDNQSNDGSLVIEVIDTGQVIKCPPFKQGYFQVMTSNKPKFYISHNGTGIKQIPIYFLNFIIAGAIW